MEKSDPKRVRKLSHKDVSKMSSADFANSMKVPFTRLLSYVKPYLGRFIMGILFGVIYGVFGAAMMFGMRFAFETLLPAGPKAQVQTTSESAIPDGLIYIEPNKKAKPGDPEAYQRPLEFEQMEGGEYAADLSKDSGTKSIKIPLMKAIKIPKPDLSSSTGIRTAILVSLIIPFLMLVRGLLQYLSNYCMLWVGMRVQHDLRSQLFAKLVRHGLHFYGKNKTGALIQTVFNQTRMAGQAGSQLSMSLVKHPVSILALVIVLFVWDWKFAVSALVVFPLCMLPVVLISNRVRKAGGQEEEEAGAIMVSMQESFSGVRTVKSYAREDYEKEKFDAGSRNMMKSILRWRKAMEIASPMVETVASFGIAAALVYAKATGMTSGQFLMMFMALIAIYPHAKALSRVQLELQKCLIATTKVFEIMDTPWEIVDAEDAVDVPNPEGGLKLENLSFGYKESQLAVENLNLEFEAGKSYALVGPSGAGKTTIFSLLMRFYDPGKGSISYDGIDLRQLRQDSLRDNIGIVNQDTFLFHDTIKNNIRYGRLDATDEEIEEAAKKANAHNFILEQDKGYDTMVGDQGSTLSGGQQQRISIARTILRDAPILLLDEAYSALDTESEKIIQEAIERLSKGKTVIAIAHRLSTILEADQIIVMDRGGVHSQGTHAQLLRKSTLYKRLYQLQFEGEASLAEKTKPKRKAAKKSATKATKKSGAKKKAIARGKSAKK